MPRVVAQERMTCFVSDASHSALLNTIWLPC